MSYPQHGHEYHSDGVQLGAGTATVLDGDTTVVVTHGAGITPDPQDIMVVPINGPTNDPGHWWVDTITGTDFTINVSANPGTSGAEFAWSVTH